MISETATAEDKFRMYAALATWAAMHMDDFADEDAQLIADITGITASDAQHAYDEVGCICLTCMYGFIGDYSIDEVDPDLVTRVRDGFATLVNSHPLWCDPGVREWWQVLQLPGKAPKTERYEVSMTVSVPGVPPHTEVTIFPLRPVVLTDPQILADHVQALARIRYDDGETTVSDVRALMVIR